MASSRRNKMEPQKQHFFQTLRPGFLTDFSIPKTFRQHLGEEGEGSGMKHAILRDINSTGLWDVKIDMDGLTLKDGWKKFCKDHDLQAGDFVVFGHNGRLIFDVYILDRISNCQPGFPAVANISAKGKASSSNNARSYGYGTNARDNAEGPVEAQLWLEETEDTKENESRFCHLVVKSYWLKMGVLYFPLVFARKNGLTQENHIIELKDERGRSWSLPLRLNKGGAIGRCSSFQIANNLKIGSDVTLEYIKSGVNPVMKSHTRHVE